MDDRFITIRTNWLNPSLMFWVCLIWVKLLQWKYTFNHWVTLTQPGFFVIIQTRTGLKPLISNCTHLKSRKNKNTNNKRGSRQVSHSTDFSVGIHWLNVINLLTEAQRKQTDGQMTDKIKVKPFDNLFMRCHLGFESRVVGLNKGKCQPISMANCHAGLTQARCRGLSAVALYAALSGRWESVSYKGKEQQLWCPQNILVFKKVISVFVMRKNEFSSLQKTSKK